MTDPLLSGWPIEINGRFPAQLILGETPPRPKKIPPPPTFIEISPGNLRLLPRPSLDLQFWATKSLVDATTGTNLIDFTRASSGTYVGSDGLIKTATTNLLLQSEDFSTTWTTTRASISSDIAIAPNGSTTADKLVEDATASSTHVTTQSGLSFTSGVIYTFSCYAKAGERQSIRLSFPSAAFTTNIYGHFNLSAGTVTTASAQVTASIQALGDSWYRCIVSATATTTATGNATIFLGEDAATASVSFDGDGTSGLYLWGAQLEQSSTVGEYVKTTSTINSAPRFDHDPTTGESLGLLVEESRTNLLTYSQDVDTSGLLININTTLDATTAPDGTLSADKIYEDTDSGEHYFQRSLASGASGTFTHSVFVKAGERSLVYMRPVHTGEAASTSSCIFDLTAGTASAPAGLASNPTITPYPNGWFRISLTVTLAGLTGTNAFRLHVYNGSALSYTGDGASGYYVWGYQVEAGAFPTSYIPTEGTTVTRAADVASISGSNFSSWYRQDASTARVEWDKRFTGSWPSFVSFFLVRDSALPNDNFISYLRANGTNSQVYYTAVTNNISQVDYAQYGVNSPGPYISAAAFTTDSAALVRGGAIRGTDSSVVMPTTLNEALIEPVNSTIRRLTYWPTRLPDSTLQTITN